MKVIFNITENKNKATFQQEVVKINTSFNQTQNIVKPKFQTGYYPLSGGGGGDLSNYYTKDETYSKTEVDDIISEIPVVDTSNLVPYNGANKDVNIGANYFKTSKGFDFTYNDDNFFRVKYGSNYNYLEFKLKDDSNNNFGSIELNVVPDAGFQVVKYDNNDLALNSFQVSDNETYSLKPFLSDVGFKTPNGTPSQYLMADGSTSTLPTDLIKGNGTENYIPKFSASGTIVNSVVYDDGSDVGIGTTAINLKGTGRRVLDINGSTQSLLSFSGNGTNLGYIWATSSNFQFASNSIITFTVGSERMRITSNGNIGIGTTSASEKLEVGGYTKATGFKTPTGTATQALRADGNVFDLNTKADLVGGKVPSSQLPSYVDDVLEFANLASFTATGESGKIYIAIDTNLTYRWTGTGYAEISASLALGETSSTAYRGDRGKIAYDHSQVVGNPHGTTKTDIGLGNVPNIDATNPTNIVQTSSYRFVTDSEKTNLSTAYDHSQTTDSNPHGTKLEQLTDVSGDATSIADTDVILKKESGGLWKKITFANFKNWFTTELAKKINIGLDTVFNFKNISAMTLTQFKALTPNLETIYFTEEQNATGWQQIKYNGLGISIPATTETLVSLTNENYLELDSDSTFNLIDVANTKINGIFEKDFVIIKFNAGVVTPATANQWFKVILKINGVQTAVSPVFYLTETSGTVEQIAHNFSLNVPAEMVTNGATLHLKTSTAMTFNNPAISVVRVHKSTNANL